MPLRVYIKRENLAVKFYYIMMAVMLISRYLLGINVPSVVLLLIAAIPAVFGSTSELLASTVSFIPLSAAFQYKYALLISAVMLLIKNRWRLKSSYALFLVFIMMAWELLHFGCGYFSIVEYVRSFAELLFMGVLIMVNIRDQDYKMIIRSLALSVVGVCTIMLIMQLQQYNFNILKVFSRSAVNWRFGQSNMDEGSFALNFDANVLGFMCNLSACGLLLLRKRKEHIKMDIVMTLAAFFFALITLSRAAILCMLMIIALYAFGGESKGIKRVIGQLSLIAVIAIAGITVYTYIPSIIENLFERFQRKDVWNGRGTLFTKYLEFSFSSPTYLLFGVGLQEIVEKVSPIVWVNQVPHNGLQEALVAWGIPGVIALLMWLGMIIRFSMVYSDQKRDFYQFVPLLLTLVFAMSVQLLTESRNIIALSFSYICLCISNTVDKQDTDEIRLLHRPGTI